jgi:NAD(P)-dependent dehydrogenase (short-subunit alcohol dehydrogenase family)
VFGASGGIGSALCAELRADRRFAKVYAGARGGEADFHFQLTDEASIADAAARIGAEGALALVIVATGMLHDDRIRPEKTWRDFRPEAFAHAFAVNATGPALIAKHFLPLLARDGKSVFAALSARVGSIADNQRGGWAAYRASKAALHQIVRTCAIELQRKNRNATCVSLHPGTVDTKLSAPFQRGVAAERLFAPGQSAKHLLLVIDDLTPEDSGFAFAWDGARIPY